MCEMAGSTCPTAGKQGHVSTFNMIDYSVFEACFVQTWPVPRSGACARNHHHLHSNKVTDKVSCGVPVDLAKIVILALKRLV